MSISHKISFFFVVTALAMKVEESLRHLDPLAELDGRELIHSFVAFLQSAYLYSFLAFY